MACKSCEARRRKLAAAARAVAAKSVRIKGKFFTKSSNRKGT